jgi:putative acetyltransferase
MRDMGKPRAIRNDYAPTASLKTGINSKEAKARHGPELTGFGVYETFSRTIIDRMQILPGDFDDPQVLALLRAHVGAMRETSPPGTSYALDLSGLRAPDISFYTIWDDATLIGMGALKEIDAGSGEIKSMRTHSDHLRKGVATKLLDYILTAARTRGYRRVSLETGDGPAFEPALTLYRRYGFIEGECFGDYTPSDFNRFFHLELA